MLSTNELSFRYPRQDEHIFTKVNVAVKRGEVLAILGPNGVGKSTFLRCLIGIEKPSAGQIFINGQSLNALSIKEIAKAVAFIAQQQHLVFSFSVRTVIELGCSPHLAAFEMPDKTVNGKVEAAADRLGIGHLLEKPFDALSGGEQQLAHIASALVQNTDYIILDEPTAHLDFANQSRFLKLVGKLAKDGIGIIFTTHTPEHAFKTADRVLLLAPSDQHCFGKPEDIMTTENLSQAYQIKIVHHIINDKHIFDIGDDEL